ncbi:MULTISPECIES: CBS domain-containing protein [unclassified Curtobacterium]|uniref:CBS domain-containing protein n=1 Tax=unclassified Curtobacterium TaxID=257496 RepID=UPI000D9799CE|nr:MULTISPECIES: CBS domain-containing protein [unclassified Curtobacterium]PYY55898.1 CBS domain-containing protein [Curtobacterium sp. MCSS17_011]WIE79233.1 CBS domain-containing protein [Curtobacterium sp. MCSS17_016]
MTTVRELMTESVECIGENDPLTQAAKLMADLDVGALPICGDDDRLKGMLTDRDIVVKCLAYGGDPATKTAKDLGFTEVVTIGADDDIQEALRMMQEHQVRRLPVIDGHRLAGMISQADIATQLPNEATGETVENISEQ